MNVIAYLDGLILLVLAHFVCDFPLQSDRMALEKVPGRDATLDWRWWLFSHAATHGLAVALMTGLPFLGLAELVFHAIIDWSKSRFRFSLAATSAPRLLNPAMELAATTHAGTSSSESDISVSDPETSDTTDADI